MADLPTDFWSGWIIMLTVVSLAGLLWLVLSVYFLPMHQGHEEGSEPVWDETLREGSNPAPMWWFWLILAAMVFSVVYLMLYPGLGSFKGALRWSQGGQLANHQLLFHQEFAATREALLQQSIPELAVNPVAMGAAVSLFSAHCAACHGSDAGGQANLFPSLRDADWQWGASAEQIEQTIRSGRTAVMIPWQAVLNDAGVNAVAGFVQTLAKGDDAEGHPGQAQYLQFCVACHGAGGEGNVLLGAPRLSDQTWLYGGDLASVRTSIAAGRTGHMPAFAERLDDLQIKLLVAWLAP